MLEPNELKELVYAQDKNVGNFEETKNEAYKMKRIQRMAKFNEKTHKVIETLQKWGLPFTLCEIIHGKKQRHRITTDIFIPDANVVIRQVDMNDEVEVSKANLFFKSMRANFYPMFIRSTDSEEFVITKLQNVLLKANQKPMKGFSKIKFIKYVKPKRPRIKAVKVGEVNNK